MVPYRGLLRRHGIDLYRVPVYADWLQRTIQVRKVELTLDCASFAGVPLHSVVHPRHMELYKNSEHLSHLRPSPFLSRDSDDIASDEVQKRRKQK